MEAHSGETAVEVASKVHFCSLRSSRWTAAVRNVSRMGGPGKSSCYTTLLHRSRDFVNQQQVRPGRIVHATRLTIVTR